MRRNPRAGARKSGGFRLEVFTDDELREIHLATLEVLSETGVFVEDDEALQIFADAGADIDRERRVACLPAHLVEDAIRSAPPKVVMYGRDPAHDVVLEDGRVGFTNFGEGIQVVDPYTGELHESLKQDVADCTRIIDALPEIDVVERPLGAHDVPPDTAALHNAEAIFSNTTKHATIGPLSGFCARKMIDMAAAIVGGHDQLRKRPIVSFLTCPVSPLKLVADACRIIIEGVRAGVPVNVLSMAMAGGSSPVNLAGTLVSHNAEVLAGITLAQLTVKGAPVIYGSSTTAMDLRFASASVGSPECAMIGAGVACLARFYLLPSWVAGA
ncbi:MAG: trimethylamine methyltransferase family protein [Actinobacteria bacterium]|nr:trimethylamine methyltransferase family protein [Actinomycetota bacterium]